jgi:hypothetical protein
MTRNSRPLKVQLDPATALLQTELRNRLDAESQMGMVDLKAMCSSDRDATTLDKLWTLNNVLRLAEKIEPEIIRPS